jgi:hypothetical protein
MCLSFDYAAALQSTRDFAATEAANAGQVALQVAHDSVDCNKIQITMLKHKDGSRTSFCHMPISSSSAVLAMYPCPRSCLGDAANYLVPCETLPCNAANLEAWYEPGKFVPIPDVVDDDDQPVYRGCLEVGGGGDRGGKAAVPIVELPPSKCIKNLNGSCTFVLKAAEFVKSDEDIEKAVASKEYPDKSTYLLNLGKACFKSLTESMDANGVDKSKIFATSEDDETEVDPLAMMNFLNELYPNLRYNNDMLVCIPGPDADGNPKMEAAFSFCFHYPEARSCWPMPGLVHNIDHTTLVLKQAVEGDYYVTSNAEFSDYYYHDDVDEMGRGTGVITHITLCNSAEFLPYDQIPVVALASGDHGDKDYHAWISGCESLQSKAQRAYWDSISTVCAKMGLPDFDKENFVSTNLVGRFLAKNTTSVMKPPWYQ